MDIGLIGLLVLVALLVFTKMPDGETSMFSYLLEHLPFFPTPERRKIIDLAMAAAAKKTVVELDAKEAADTVQPDLVAIEQIAAGLATGSADVNRHLASEALTRERLKSGPIINFIKGLFGGNLLPILVIGGLVAFLAFGGVGGCDIFSCDEPAKVMAPDE